MNLKLDYTYVFFLFDIVIKQIVKNIDLNVAENQTLSNLLINCILIIQLAGWLVRRIVWTI